MLERPEHPAPTQAKPSDNGTGGDNQQERPEMASSEITRSATTRRKKINRTHLAYAAGILDGEGCISATWNPRPYASARVNIVNTDTGLLDWFKATFGGNYYLRAKTQPHYKQPYVWVPARADLIWFLKLMIPFLRIKQQQAYTAMALQSAIDNKRELAVKTRLVEQLHQLNSGG